MLVEEKDVCLMNLPVSKNYMVSRKICKSTLLVTHVFFFRREVSGKRKYNILSFASTMNEDTILTENFADGGSNTDHYIPIIHREMSL